MEDILLNIVEEQGVVDIINDYKNDLENYITIGELYTYVNTRTNNSYLDINDLFIGNGCIFYNGEEYNIKVITEHEKSLNPVETNISFSYSHSRIEHQFLSELLSNSHQLLRPQIQRKKCWKKWTPDPDFLYVDFFGQSKCKKLKKYTPRKKRSYNKFKKSHYKY